MADALRLDSFVHPCTGTTRQAWSAQDLKEKVSLAHGLRVIGKVKSEDYGEFQTFLNPVKRRN